MASGAIIGGPIATTPLDVTSVASGALDRAGGGTSSASAPATTTQPARHQVRRGETAYSIARTYNISVRSLAEWNGLGPDLNLREGQYLMIPVPTQTAGNSGNTNPGQGTPTPLPPSAAKPLPAEKTEPASAQAKNTPKSPELGQDRTAASASAFAMPVDGKIIRGYARGRNDGIDIAAPAGTTVRAAADGTVAAITKDTDQVPILVIRHSDNVLSVYAGIDALRVQKGAKVTRGQPIAVIRQATPSFLHFELRKGVESIDPMTKLQ
jgi:murein DD-endopeptidase MepM/ murein hydrolase activator NlpD